VGRAWRRRSEEQRENEVLVSLRYHEEGGEPFDEWLETAQLILIRRVQVVNENRVLVMWRHLSVDVSSEPAINRYWRK
jgi:hypothetical protein